MMSPECSASKDCVERTDEPICLPDATCGACKRDEDCKLREETTPLCAADGACVACRGAVDCEDPALPVCDPQARACRACAADVECESGACDLAEGRCFAASDVYVVDDGSACGSGDGSTGAPFCSMAEAMAAFAAAPRNFITVRDGQYVFPPLASSPLPAFIGTANAEVHPATSGGDCLVLDASARLDLRGFHFVGCGTALRIGATATQAGINGTHIDGSVIGLDCRANACVATGLQVGTTTTAVHCSNGARCTIDDASIAGGDVGFAISGATLLLHDSLVAGARLYGLQIADSEADVQHTTVREIGKTGTGATAAVVCTGSYCTFDRTRIVGSRGAGLVLRDGSFEVYSSAILGNGSDDATLPYNGGVVVMPGTAATRIFQNNTVAGNRAAGSSTGGVRCNAAVALKSSIVWGNSGTPLDASCSASYSDVDGAVLAAGVGNLRADPKLASVTPGAMDEHIATDSPCIDAGDPGATMSRDIDGQARPSNGRVDIGADESI
jgi:hypothetical protein